MYREKTVIGIGGSIGSGKTMVSRILESLGCHYISADEIGHQVLPEIAKRLRERFGDDIMKDGMIDRKKLAQLVFANVEDLEYLNQLSHPLLIQRLKTHIADAPGTMVVVDAALLFDWPDIMEIVDYPILVVADEQLKEQRAIQSGIDPFIYKKIHKQQKKDEELMQYAHFIIENNGTVDSLHEQCYAVFKEIQNGH